MRARAPLAVAVAVAVGLCTPAASAPRYQDFGNSTYNDCAYESMANLTIHEYPSARISTAQVVHAWRTTETAWDSGLIYAQRVGFDGHHAGAETELTIGNRPQLIHAANHGGVWATVLGGAHAVAIIGANPDGVRVVDDGANDFYSWGAWRAYQEGGAGPSALSQDVLVSVTWP